MTQLFLNEHLDTEPFCSSSSETTIETFSFSVPADDDYFISLSIPLTVNNTSFQVTNAACRVYLNEVLAEKLLFNGGQWTMNNIPFNGRCSGCMCIHLAQGQHSLIVRGVTSNSATILTLRSRRRYQVFT